MKERPPSHPKVRTPEAAASLRPDMARGFSIGGGMDLQTFMAKVVDDVETGCWLWMGWRNQKGYGQVWVNGKSAGAHRVSWSLHNGPIPEGLCVCHTCDNPPCVNPAHLWVGTNAENHEDKVAKKRHGYGETHSKAKLTERDVLDIRASRESDVALARRYGVTHQAVASARSGEHWKHIPQKRSFPPIPHRKLTEESVRAIRSSTKTDQAWADSLGVSRQTVSDARTGRCWSHVPSIAVEKENKPRGEAHVSAKLTEDDVRVIRASTESCLKLAEIYGMADSSIWAARTGKTWRHVK